jgi:hypothetical protein
MDGKVEAGTRVQGGDASVPALLSEADLARRWRLSERTLQRQRANRTGPAWLRLGCSVRYRLDDILAFEADARRGGKARP